MIKNLILNFLKVQINTVYKVIIFHNLIIFGKLKKEKIEITLF